MNEDVPYIFPTDYSKVQPQAKVPQFEDLPTHLAIQRVLNDSETKLNSNDILRLDHPKLSVEQQLEAYQFALEVIRECSALVEAAVNKIKEAN